MTEKENNSASKIQRFWKCYIDRQVFKYYCRLIDFKNQGDPSTILKCINPRETDLFDSAFGAKVKFRLGGEKFPPNIYYKIFTSRPIQDLCANSPKNYCKIRQQAPRFLHNRMLHNNPIYIEHLTQQNTCWYQRIENNGWRQISDRALGQILFDPISGDSAIKPVENFVHDKNKRMINKKLKKKRRKIEWMRKLYNLDNIELNKQRLNILEHIKQQNPLQTSMDECSTSRIIGPDDALSVDSNENKSNLVTNDPRSENISEDTRKLHEIASIKAETKVLVRKAAESLLQTFDLKGEDYVEEWAVDELLKWTSGLNYEDYFNDWCIQSTTLASDWKLNLDKQNDSPR